MARSFACKMGQSVPAFTPGARTADGCRPGSWRAPHPRGWGAQVETARCALGAPDCMAGCAPLHLAAGGMKAEARLPSRLRCRVGFASSWRAGAPPASPMARLGVVIYERREAVKAPEGRYGSLRASLFICHLIFTIISAGGHLPSGAPRGTSGSSATRWRVRSRARPVGRSSSRGLPGRIAT